MALVTNCPSCGARIDAQPAAAAYVYTCRFCGRNVEIDPLPAARGSRPDVMRIEIGMPSEAIQRQVVITNAARAAGTAGKSLGCIIAGATLLPVLIPLFIFVGPLVSKTWSSRFGSFPVEVGMNDDVEIADRDATSDETLVTLGVNGKITLRRCHLKGPLIVKGGVNAEVTIIDSTLEGTKGVIQAETNLVLRISNSTITSHEEIVDAPINAKVTIDKDSKLHADGIALPLEGNAEVTIDHSTLEGKLGAIEVKNNGKVKMLDGAVVKSDGPAIDLVSNGHLQIAASRVESKTTAIKAGSNAEGTIRSTTVIGPKDALDLGSNARLTLSQDVITGPRKVGANSAIDER